MAITVFKSPLGREHYGNDGMERVKPSCRICVFVQTKTSIVFRMDLYRGDNAHTVKRRLLIALSVPVEECSLTFGDMVLKNDIILVAEMPEVLWVHYDHESGTDYSRPFKALFESLATLFSLYIRDSGIGVECIDSGWLGRQGTALALRA
ncbi:phosphatidylinositol 4-kinase gamma 7-like protein [Tanacetum coccineum]